MIRRAVAADAEAVVRVFQAARTGAMPWLPVLHTTEEDVGFFGRALAGEAYVFELDGAVAGFAVVGEAELDHLYVEPDAQGRGIGSALFALVAEVRPNGFRLWVFRDNTAARRFYEARGCRVVRGTDGADNEERTPDVLYEWSPPAPATAC